MMLMTANDVSAFAVAGILEAETEVDSDLAYLTSAGALLQADVEERLISLSERCPVVHEETAVKRWLLASLVEVDRAELGEGAMLALLQDIYAEFGFPEELRYVSPYNFTFEERAAEAEVGDAMSSPLEWLRRALHELRTLLVPVIEEGHEQAQ
jgi:hypothetical protein